MSNISGDRGEKLFLALDGGTVSDTLPSVRYKAVLKVDGTEYTILRQGDILAIVE